MLVAAAVLLPYVAVVMANAASSRSDGFALTTLRRSRPELPRGTTDPTALGESDNI